MVRHAKLAIPQHYVLPTNKRTQIWASKLQRFEQTNQNEKKDKLFA